MGIWSDKRVLVTGGTGFLGQYVCRKLQSLSAKVIAPRSAEYDLTDQRATEKLFGAVNPEIVLHLASRVGGIEYNKTRHGEQLYQNTIILLNVMNQCMCLDVKKIVLVSSVCAYPCDASIPFEENDLMGHHPERTIVGYGTAKRFFIPVAAVYSEQYKMDIALPILANLYGPNDNFNLSSCHVIPAMIHKLYHAKINQIQEVTFWGSGNATREFLYIEDAAEIILTAAEKDIGYEPFNVGGGEEVAIKELAFTIAKIIDYRGKIKWDTLKPDGHPRRSLNTNIMKRFFLEMKMTNMADGLRSTVEWYLKQNNKEG